MMGFDSYYLLLKGDHCRFLNQYNRAHTYFHQANVAASSAGLMHLVSLGNELMSLLAEKRGYVALSKFYISEAYQSYYHWGAYGKCDHLKATSNLYHIQPHYNLDVNSIVRAFQILSGELVLDRFLKSMLHLMLEHAGAQRGVFILNKDNELRVEAEGSVSPDGYKAVGSVPIQDYSKIPISLLNYVNNSVQEVVLEDASKDDFFRQDPYFVESDLKSALCIPIRKHQDVLGLLYLENHLPVFYNYPLFRILAVFVYHCSMILYFDLYFLHSNCVLFFLF